MIEIGSVQWNWMKWWETNKDKVLESFANGTSIVDMLKGAYFAGHEKGSSGVGDANGFSPTGW